MLVYKYECILVNKPVKTALVMTGTVLSEFKHDNHLKGYILYPVRF